MLFIFWSCSPLPRRGLIVWVKMLVKGRVCRSPLYITFLTLHPSIFTIVVHPQCFMVLLIPAQKCWKTFSLKANQHVRCHFRVWFFLCILLSQRFFCLVSSHPTLTSWEGVCCLAEWLQSIALEQQKYLVNVFQWNHKSKNSNCTIVLKGKDIAEFIQKEKNMSSRSQLVSTNSSLHCSHTSLVTLINR